MEEGDNKRKSQVSKDDESPSKMQKRNLQTSGGFINAMISQWSKCTGTQFPPNQLITGRETCMSSQTELERKNTELKYKVQALQKKLQEVEQMKTSLSTALDVEGRAREEISTKLNATWVSIDTINTYFDYISDSLIGFQEHCANLATVYETVKTTQNSTTNVLKEEVSKLTLKVAEQELFVSEAKNTLTVQEESMQNLKTDNDALRKRVQDYENNLSSEKSHLMDELNKEREELRKEQELIMSEKLQLMLRLKEVEEKQEKANELLRQKETCSSKLQDEIIYYKNKVKDLSTANEELFNKCEALTEEKNEISNQFKLKLEEIIQCSEKLRAEQKKQNDLEKNLCLLEEEVLRERNQCNESRNNLFEMETRLRLAESRNVELENTLTNMKNDSKVTADLYKKIESLQRENKELLLEKQSMTQVIHEHKAFKNNMREIEAKLKKGEERNKELESMINSTKHNHNTAVIELRKKIESLQREKDDLLSENHLKLQEIQQYRTSRNNLSDVEAKLRKEARIKELENIIKDTKINHDAELKELRGQIESLERKKQEVSSENRPNVENEFSLKPILKSPKTVIFDFNSSPDDSPGHTTVPANDEQFSELCNNIDAQLTQPIAASQIEGSKIDEKQVDTGGRKFFKRRTTAVRQYGSQKKRVWRK